MGLPGAFIELLFDLADDVARVGNWLQNNLIAGLGVLFIVIFGFWSVDRLFDSESRVFTTSFWEEAGPEGIRNLVWAIATVFAGAAGLYGLWLAGRRTAALDRQAEIAHAHRELAEQGQITERFTKAVEQLESSNSGVKVGAVFALERLASDSARDLNVVAETLSAFVRHESANVEKDKSEKVEIVAAIRVLARMVPVTSELRIAGSSTQLDLSNAYLANATLRSCNLSGFNLSGANFSHCDLKLVKFDGCDLGSANLSKAMLVDVSLMGVDAFLANFNESYFASCDLREAKAGSSRFIKSELMFSTLKDGNFESADFSEANLFSVSFSSARLRDANFGKSVFFYDVDFQGANISGADFSEISNDRPDVFERAKYSGRVPPKNLLPAVTLPEPDRKLTDEEMVFDS